jgi:hypothetical protein
MKSLGIVCVAAMAACQATTSSPPNDQTVTAVSAGSGSFAKYRTFGFRLAERPPAPYQVSARSFEVERRVHDLITADLVRKGYSEAAANADFVIRLSSGTAAADKTAPTTTSGGSENDPLSVTAGQIVVDAFDGSNSQQIWHGTARAEVDPQRINEAALEAAVQKMLATLPTCAACASASPSGAASVSSATVHP